MNNALGQCVLSANESPPKAFTFDGVYFMDSTSEQIYNDIIYPLVESVVEGYNGTVFAYGQTGAGKTFSMQGDDKVPAQRGVIPRTFEQIFESVATIENTKFLVHVSYLEVSILSLITTLLRFTTKKFETYWEKTGPRNWTSKKGEIVEST